MLRRLADGQAVAALHRLAERPERTSRREMRGEDTSLGVLASCVQQRRTRDPRRRRPLAYRARRELLLPELGPADHLAQGCPLRRRLQTREDRFPRLLTLARGPHLLLQRIRQRSTCSGEGSWPGGAPATETGQGHRGKACGLRYPRGRDRVKTRPGLPRQLRRELRLRRLAEQPIQPGIAPAQRAERVARVEHGRRPETGLPRLAPGILREPPELPLALLHQLAKRRDVRRRAGPARDGAHAVQQRADLAGAVTKLVAAFSAEAREDRIHPREVRAQLSGGRVGQRAVLGRREARERLLHPRGYRIRAVVPAFEDPIQRQPRDRGTAPRLRYRAQVQDGWLLHLVLLGARIQSVLPLRRLEVALRSQPGLPQPLVPGAGAVALLAQAPPPAVIFLEQAFVAQRLGQHRRGPVDGGLPLLQQADQRVALPSRELRELEAEAGPALDALVQIDFQVELLALLLEEGEAAEDAVDLVLGRPLLLQGAAEARHRLVERPGRLVPVAQERPKTVGRLRLTETPLETGGFARRLDHQAVEMLHLEPARRARQVPLRINCPGRRPVKFIRTEGKRSRAYLVVRGPWRKTRICSRSSALRCVFFSAFMRSRTTGQSFRSPGSYARWQDVHLARYTRSSGESGREGAELQAATARRSAAAPRFTG